MADTSPSSRRQAPRITRVRTKEDIMNLRLQDGFIVAEVDPKLFLCAKIRNSERESGPRLRQVMRSIMSKGFQPLVPITLRVDADGGAEVLDGGHRITALRTILANPIRRWLTPKITSIYVVIFVDELSWSAPGSEMPAFLTEGQGDLPKARVVQPRDSQISWERSAQRRNAV